MTEPTAQPEVPSAPAAPVLTSPEDGASFDSGASVTVTGTAAVDGSAVLYDGDTIVDTASVASGSFTFAHMFADGPHALSVTVSGVGGISERSNAVTVQVGAAADAGSDDATDAGEQLPPEVHPDVNATDGPNVINLAGDSAAAQAVAPPGNPAPPSPYIGTAPPAPVGETPAAPEVERVEVEKITYEIPTTIPPELQVEVPDTLDGKFREALARWIDSGSHDHLEHAVRTLGAQWLAEGDAS